MGTMTHFITQLTLAFVPLFFAMNVIGVVPIFLNLTEDLSPQEKSNLTRNACFAVLGVSVLFVFAGAAIFAAMGITADDFRVGGGIIILIIAIVDLVFKQEKSRRDPSATVDASGLGIVPVGIPLIVGPAALTTMLMLVDKYGYFMTIVVLALNLAAVYAIFTKSYLIVRVLRPGGIKVFSKVASLFLAAIAVMMIRVGIVNIISHSRLM
jgi:multiple antibiotic resistance protein